MNNSYLDYDYPTNSAKPVNPGRPLGSNGLNHLSVSATVPSFSGTGPFANNNDRARWESIFKTHSSKQSIHLETVVPLSKPGLVSPSGTYYSVPKNIPVNPMFASPATTANQVVSPLNQVPLVVTPKFPVAEPSALYDRPKLPQKSSLVLNKMSNYMNPSIPSHFDSSDTVKYDKLPVLTKHNTSKPLPPLPGSLSSVPHVPQAIATSELVDQTNGNYSVPVKFDLDVVDGADSKCAINGASKYTDIYACSPDDDEEDCDYDYDYVCLESKKKLDDEDENIKKLITRDLQSKYERLVLNSAGFDLQSIEKSMQHFKTLSPNIKRQYLQSYRHFLSISLKNFESWINLSLEIIGRKHPPGVYFNFTKHILLSGQNLLLVAKSLNRHYGQMENLSHFADKFYDYLRAIVLKTKKSASDFPNPKSIGEMVESIQCALRFTSTLNVELCQ